MKFDSIGIHPGMKRIDALQAFRSASNTSDTLFITPSWFDPREDRLRRLLSDIISADESVALQDVLMKRQHIDTLIDWLSNRRTVSWGVHVEKVAAEKAALAEVQERERRSSHSAWLAEIRAMSRPPCHTCKSTDEVVPIFYGLMDNMDLPTFGLFVRGGCVIDLEDPRWLCKRCDESFRD